MEATTATSAATDKKRASACSGCTHTRQCLNGLYCLKLNKYVEHATHRQC